MKFNGLPEDGLIPNDGGQRWTSGKFGSGTHYSAPEFRKAGNHYTGQIIAFQPAEQFTYVCGDVTQAYTGPLSGTDHPDARSKRVRKFLRTLLYLPPDHLIVFDQVESFNKDFKKRWILHSVNEPKVDGNLATIEHTETVLRNKYYAWAWDGDLKHAIHASKDHPFFKQHPDCPWFGNQPQLYTYDGVMFVQALLPSDREITAIGGPGKEFWVNGVNYHMGGHERKGASVLLDLQPHLISGEAGRWRIEVSPTEPAEDDLFLTVIQVGIKSQGPRPTPARAIKPAGLEIDLGSGRKATVTFKKGVGGHIRIERAGATLLEEALAERVLPNLEPAAASRAR